MARSTSMARDSSHPEPREGTAAAEPAESRRLPWSWRIGTVLGIPVDVHATFLILLGWLALAPLVAGESVASALGGVLLVLAVFATVVLHELAHAAVARRFGAETRRILLLPIGGVSSLEKMPERPIEELLVAIAGPLVNITIAGALALVLSLSGEPLGAPSVRFESTSFLVTFLWINVSIAVLNLLPAFPMDGGRVLRALLSMSLGRDRATKMAAALGRGFALILAVVGFVLQPMLMLIALFVWTAARAEEWLEHTRSVLHGVPIRRVMVSRIEVLPPEATVAHAAEVALSGFQHDFPVVAASGRLAGLLTRSALLRALASGNAERAVGEIMLRDPVVGSPDEMLDAALERMDRSGIGMMVVLENGTPVGLVTAESALELVTQRDALAAVPTTRATSHA